MECRKCGSTCFDTIVDINVVTLKCFYCAEVYLFFPALPPIKRGEREVQEWECQVCHDLVYSKYFVRYCDKCRPKVRKKQMRKNSKAFRQRAGTK